MTGSEKWLQIVFAGSLTVGATAFVWSFVLPKEWEQARGEAFPYIIWFTAGLFIPAMIVSRKVRPRWLWLVASLCLVTSVLAFLASFLSEAGAAWAVPGIGAMIAWACAWFIAFRKATGAVDVR